MKYTLETRLPEGSDLFRGLVKLAKPKMFNTKNQLVEISCYTHECPKCYGRGNWWYSSITKTVCSMCDGAGWVTKADPCDHVWSKVTNVGNCLNEYTCSKCSKKQVVDSSD